MQLTVEQQHQLIDRVLHLDTRTYEFGGPVDANVNLVYSWLERNAGSRQWDVRNDIHAACVGAAQRGELATNPRYVEIFQTVFADEQFRPKSGSEANEQLILAELIKRQVYPPENPLTTENLAAVVIDLWDNLATNPEAAAASEAQKTRLRRIAEMTGNSTHGFSIVRAGGKKTAYDKDGRVHDPNRGMVQQGLSMSVRGPWSPGQSPSWDQMSDAQVAQLYDEWVTSERFKNMSVEELRAVVKGGTTEFGNHQSIRLPNVVAPRDEGALINEKTGAEITTQKELLRYISDPSDPYAGRRLITHKSSGKVIPAKQQRFESIIRGELG